MLSLLCPPILLFRAKVWKKFKLDLVNDLVKDAIETLSAKERDGRILLDIIKAKRFNPNRAIDNRAAFGLVLVLTSNGIIISSKSGKTKPLLSIIFER